MDIQEKIFKKVGEFIGDNKGNPSRLYLGEKEYKELCRIFPKPREFAGLGVLVVNTEEHIEVA